MPRILVVAPNWIGDALMAQPLLARLREKGPALRLDVLAPAWVAPVMRRMPEVDEVIDGPFGHGALEVRARWRLGRGLRSRGYDQAIVLPNTWKSALVPFLADIPVRSGYVGESRYGLLNLLYRDGDDTRTPMAHHYARLSEPPGKAPPEPLPTPRLHADPDTVAATATRFGFAAAPALNAVFCPGAEYGPAKRWPARYYAELAARLGERGVQPWLLGSASERAVCDEVERESRGVARNLAGRTSLDEAIDLIAAARFVVTNDSGLMHVAAALDRPQIAIFGSSSPEHTPPRSAHARIARIEIACSPCFARVCPLGHFRCMNDLEVRRVLAEIERLGVLPSPAPREATGRVEQDLPTPQDAESAFYEALERCDLDSMMSVWAEDEEIVCIHPTGPRLTGLEQVRESWRRMFAGGPSTRVHVTQQVTLSAMMVAVHSVHEHIAVSGETRPRSPMLATNVYLRTAAGWRMIVHHASPAPAQPQAPLEAPKILH